MLLDLSRFAGRLWRWRRKVSRRIFYERNENKEMKMNFKRFLAFVLVMVMVFAYVPAGAFATEGAVPALPTATVSEVQNDDLTFAMNFKADEASAEQLAYYGNWYADFVLTVNKDVTFNANGGADGYLSGQYDEWSENWVSVPFEDVTLKANEPLKIMEYASELMNKTGLKLTYKDVYTSVKDFDCGVYFEPDFLAANPDLEVTLELKMYDPKNEAKGYVIGESYVFGGSDFVAKNVETGKIYSDVSKALETAEDGQTVILLKETSDEIVTVLEDTTFDLNGFKLTAEYVACFGDIIDSSEMNDGRLVVDAGHFLTQDKNAQLPVKTADGYMFAEILGYNEGYPTIANGIKYAFQPLVEAAALDAMKAADSGIAVEVLISWKEGTRRQNFVFDQDRLLGYLDSYNSATGKFSKMFSLTITGAEDMDIQFQSVLCSNTGVTCASADFVTNAEQTLTAGNSSAVVPEGVKLAGNAKTLTLNTSRVKNSDVPVETGETLRSVDVHVDGLAANNTVPIIVTLDNVTDPGLNQGSLKLYHVENGENKEMTQVWSLADVDAHNEFYYDPATGIITMALKSFSEIAMISDNDNAWSGNFDYSWYYADATELTIANADQLAAFGAIVGGMNGQNQDSFKDKTVKLIANINLGDKESENNPNIIFYPIGYYNSEGTYERTNTAITSGFRNFEGTFDGNGHTISNFYQNTWEMKGDNDEYDLTLQYYRDGMGLFGRVYGGTVKNLHVRNFSSDGEYTTTGVIAAYADFGATFENIAIFNCNPRVYNIGNGGIVGCVGWYTKGETETPVTFRNITVDNSNKISALWGSWDVACGGIVGQYYPISGQTSAGSPENGGIKMENCHVSAQIDVYNDVCANYQYYAYRYAGMLIGSIRENETIDGHVYPDMTGITTKNCTVHYGDWNDYYYCELVANSQASYTHDYQMSRLVQVASVDVENKKVISLDGETTAIPTSGRVNYVVVKAKDANGMWIHGDGHDFADCYHFVNGEQHFHDVADADNPNPTETVNGVEGVLKEDKQLIYREFTQLFTGYGWGVTSKGLDDFENVEKMDISRGDHAASMDKFERNPDAISFNENETVTIAELFAVVDNKIDIRDSNVIVTVSRVGKGSSVSAKYNPNNDKWDEGKLTFYGTGAATITITDYYFCMPLTIDVQIDENTGGWA